MQKWLLVLLLGFFPWVFGLPWANMMKSKCVAVSAYGFGYFVFLALFHLVAFTGTVRFLPFHVIAEIFNVVICVALAVAVVYCIQKRGLLFGKGTGAARLTWFEALMLILFFALLGLQIYHGIFSDISYMSYDDAVYTAYALDALKTDRVGFIDPYTGTAGRMMTQRAIQTSLILPAYLSLVSGISVASVQHTVQYVQLILLAYSIYYYMANELFETRENRLVFLSFIALFFVFGYHSNYSLTFRLLGPNYQGKAVLAVSLTPLILTFWKKQLGRRYHWKAGVLLFFYSLSSVSLTLWGAGTMVALVVIPVLLALLQRNRQWKLLLYIPWGLIAPLGYIGYHLIYRYAV